MPLITVDEILNGANAERSTQINPKLTKYIRASRTTEIGNTLIHLVSTEQKNIIGTPEVVNSVQSKFDSAGIQLIPRMEKNEWVSEPGYCYINIDAVLKCCRYPNGTYSVDFVDGTSIYVDKAL